jgi:hypothetical protein
MHERGPMADAVEGREQAFVCITQCDERLIVSESDRAR